MQSEGFEPTIPGIRRLQTYALDCTTTSSGKEIMEKPWILTEPRYRKLFHHLAHIYSNIPKFISCAKCRLKPVAINRLRLKLQQVTSLSQSCCPFPLVQKLHNVFEWGFFIYWSGHSCYYLKYFMVLFSASNHMPKQCLKHDARPSLSARSLLNILSFLST